MSANKLYRDPGPTPGWKDLTAEDRKYIAAGNRVGWEKVGNRWLKTRLPGHSATRTTSTRTAPPSDRKLRDESERIARRVARLCEDY